VIVLDASALLAVLLDRPAGARVAAVFSSREREVAAPHLVDAEVAQVVRRYAARGELSEHVAVALVDDFLELPIVRYAHGPLLRRAFELRHNATIYDALYLALAEGLDCPLLTADRALASVPECRAAVEVIPD